MSIFPSDISPDLLAVLLIFGTEGFAQEVLLLPYLKVQHHYRKDSEQQMDDVRESHQQTYVHQVKAYEGGITADAVYAPLDEGCLVGVWESRSPAVGHGQHSDYEESYTDSSNSQSSPLQDRERLEYRDECHLRIQDDADYLYGDYCKRCPSHNIFNQEDLPGLVTLAYLIGGDALSALCEFLSQKCGIDHRHYYDCRDFGCHSHQ